MRSDFCDDGAPPRAAPLVAFSKKGRYLFRGCRDQDGVFQLGERLLDVEQHAGLQQMRRPVWADAHPITTQTMTSKKKRTHRGAVAGRPVKDIWIGKLRITGFAIGCSSTRWQKKAVGGAFETKKNFPRWPMTERMKIKAKGRRLRRYRVGMNVGQVPSPPIFQTPPLFLFFGIELGTRFDFFAFGISLTTSINVSVLVGRRSSTGGDGPA